MLRVDLDGAAAWILHFERSLTDANDVVVVVGCRLHGVCKDNPLAPVIGKLGLPLYRTCGDNSVLYDHDLER